MNGSYLKVHAHRQAFLLWTVAVFALAPTWVQAAAPKPVVIEQPAGGEVYIIGSQQVVRTALKPKYKTIRVELSRDGGATFSEVLGTIDNTAKDKTLRNILSWSVTGPASDACVIQAVGILRDLSEVESTSGPFSIGNIDVDISSPDSRYVQVAGDTMTGLLVLSADPSANLGAATKQYVDGANSTQDTAISGKVAKSGDTMTGALTLNADPSQNLHAATKQYVDSGVGGRVSKSGDTMSGNLAMSGNKVTGLGAASANGEAVRFEQAVKSGDSAGGDLTGTYPSPTVDATKVQKRVTGTAPAGQFITGINQDGTVATATDNGVPAGYGILGDSSTPSTGFSYSGFSIDVMNRWRPRADVPTAREDAGVAVVNGKIYVIGGNDGGGASNINEEYDPVANTWATKAAMPTAREAFAVAVVNGKIYAIGGFGPLTKNDEYDPVANTWSTKASMPTARFGCRAATVGGKIYVIGGNNNTSKLGANEEYDPSLDSWATKTDMPTVRGGFGIAVASDKIYAFGGGTSPRLVTEEYDPGTNTWATKSPMLISQGGLGGTLLDGRIYAIGGEDDGGSAITTVQAYDPVNDFWSVKQSMITGRYGLGVATVSGLIYAIGGRDGGGFRSENEELSVKQFFVHTKD